MIQFCIACFVQVLQFRILLEWCFSLRLALAGGLRLHRAQMHVCTWAGLPCARVLVWERVCIAFARVHVQAYLAQGPDKAAFDKTLQAWRPDELLELGELLNPAVLKILEADRKLQESTWTH